MSISYWYMRCITNSGYAFCCGRGIGIDEPRRIYNGKSEIPRKSAPIALFQTIRASIVFPITIYPDCYANLGRRRAMTLTCLEAESCMRSILW